MKIDAVGVTSRNLEKTVTFYTLLGFRFPAFNHNDQHVEAIPEQGAVRLMIDSHKLANELLGEDPQPSNHSPFALLYDSAQEVDETVKRVSEAGFTIFKEPWDAFWGQRYAVVVDPDGYHVDLFAQL